MTNVGDNNSIFQTIILNKFFFPFFHLFSGTKQGRSPINKNTQNQENPGWDLTQHPNPNAAHQSLNTFTNAKSQTKKFTNSYQFQQDLHTKKHWITQKENPSTGWANEWKGAALGIYLVIGLGGEGQ